MDLSGSSKADAYAKRRMLMVLLIIVAIAVVSAILAISSPNVNQTPVKNNSDSSSPYAPPPVYEKEKEVVIVEDDGKKEIIIIEDEPEIICILPPFPELGCLKDNPPPNIFDAYGMRTIDDNVDDMIEEVEDECVTEPIPDTQCIIDTTLVKSEGSWACEWDCLEDMDSCIIYKTHLAVAVLRQFVPPTDVFVGRTDDYDYYILYLDYSQGSDGWMIQQPHYIGREDKVRKDTVSLYNDVYYAGVIDDVVFPDIFHVDLSDDNPQFCFDVPSDESCACEVDIGTFTVGECPQLPADLRGICDETVDYVYINPGNNRICFEVSEDAEEELYTYKFDLTSGEDHYYVGGALVTTRSYDCCVDASFEGFIEITDDEDD